MKNLKSILSALLFAVIVLSSCKKEVVVPVEQTNCYLCTQTIYFTSKVEEYKDTSVASTVYCNMLSIDTARLKIKIEETIILGGNLIGRSKFTCKKYGK